MPLPQSHSSNFTSWLSVCQLGVCTKGSGAGDLGDSGGPAVLRYMSESTLRSWWVHTTLSAYLGTLKNSVAFMADPFPCCSPQHSRNCSQETLSASVLQSPGLSCLLSACSLLQFMPSLPSLFFPKQSSLFWGRFSLVLMALTEKNCTPQTSLDL